MFRDRVTPHSDVLSKVDPTSQPATGQAPSTTIKSSSDQDQSSSGSEDSTSNDSDSGSDVEGVPAVQVPSKEHLGATVIRACEIKAVGLVLLSVGIVHTRTLSLAVSCSRCATRMDVDLLPESPVCVFERSDGFYCGRRLFPVASAALRCLLSFTRP